MQQPQPHQHPHQNPQPQNKTHQFFFTDQHGPFQTAPKYLQDLLSALRQKQEQSFKIQNFDFDKLPFKIRNTPTNCCGGYFKLNQEYYICKVNNRNCYYCIECYENSHQQHPDIENSDTKNQMMKQTQVFGTRLTCSCGKSDKIKVCSRHASYDKQFQCQITAQQRQQFMQCFSSLIQCFLYLKNDAFLSNLLKYLIKLNKDSIFYNRLTYNLLNLPHHNQSNINSINPQHHSPNNKNFHILSTNLPSLILFMQLITHLTQDLKTRKQLIKASEDFTGFLSQMYNYQILIIIAIRQIIHQGWSSIQFYHTINNLEFGNQLSEEELQKFNFNTLVSVNSIEELNDFVGRNNPRLSLNQQKDIFVFFNKIVNLLEKKSIKNYPNSEQKQQQLEQQKLIIVTLSRLIVINPNIKTQGIRNYLNENIQNSYEIVQNSIRKILLNNNTKFLQQLTKNNQCKEHIKIVTLLMLINQSKNRQQLIQLFWKNLLSCSTNVKNAQYLQYSQQHKIKLKLFENYRNTISNILNADLIILLNYWEYLESQNKKIQESEKNILETYYKNLLYEIKSISQQDIIKQVVNGYFNFDSFGIILNQVCEYDSQRHNFTYENVNKYNNFEVAQFPINLSSKFQLTLEKSKINCESSIDLQNRLPVSKSLLNILESKVIYQCMKIAKQNRQKQDGEFLNRYIRGSCYIYFLITYNIFTRRKNPQIGKELQQISKNSDIIKQYAQNQKQSNQHHQPPFNNYESFVLHQQKIIKRLLNLQQSQNHQKEDNNKQQNNNLGPFVRNYQLKYPQKDYKEGKLCILCHQKQNQGAILMYPCRLQYRSAFYAHKIGKQFYMKKCGHVVHINCFIKQKNKSYQKNYSCPYCFLPENIILPSNYDPKNIQQIKVCQNILNQCFSLQFKLTDQISTFMFLFKYLVQSKRSLYDCSRDKRKQNIKQSQKQNERFILCNLIECFQKSSEIQQNIHLNQIKQYQKQISLDKSEQFVFTRVLLAEYIRSLVLKQKSDITQKLTKLRSLIQQKQFQAFYTYLTQLTQEKFNLPEQTQQEKSKKKVNVTFKLIDFPQNVVDFKNKFRASEKCIHCKKNNNQIVCLMCGQVSCFQCQKNHIEQSHNNFPLGIFLRNLQLLHSVPQQSQRIFENEFKISYSQKKQHKNIKILSEESRFNLNKKKFDSIIYNLIIWNSV